MDQGLDTVVDISDDGDLDHQATFDALWSILSAQEERIAQRFLVEADSAYEDLAGFGGESGWRGHLHAAAGAEMDWMVRSWSGDPGAGVTSMQLAAWLGPHVDVPHLNLKWGTLPELWFSQDYVARRDVAVDQGYLRRYFGPTNEKFLELKADDGLSLLTNRSLAARQHVSHTAFCFICKDAHLAGRRAARIDQIGRLAEQRVTDWLEMVDAAEAVPEQDRAVLADRDLRVRRSMAETDPANLHGARYQGEELTGRLVGALWGAERRLPRPGS